MRAIKFRAWDSKNRVMINPVTSMSASDGNFQNLGGRGEGWIVMQFTGLTDKNGKEIYEGDICKYRKYSHPQCIGDYKEKIGYVVFINGSFSFRNGAFTEVTSIEYFNDDVDIIGNIHENPELRGGV